MARFMRLDVLNTIVNTGMVPVFYHTELETAKNIIRASTIQYRIRIIVGKICKR